MEKINVLVINKIGGSGFHRLTYPFSKLIGSEVEGKEIEIVFENYDQNLTLKKAENFNILIYHWDCEASLQDLALLRNKGVKIIYSLDDFWAFSEMHPNYQGKGYLRFYTENRVKQHLLQADAVIVTTEKLMLQCKPYADNIAILPNFLNPEDFKQYSVKTESSKLKVAMIGSLSHYPDYLMMKQIFNRLARNKELVDKCQFQLCGVDFNNQYWKELIDMFKKKKNLDFVFKEYLPVDRYMEFYKDCDVVMCPLEYTEFNVAKSSLKLAECLVTNTLPIGSSLYSGKELKGIVVCETPLSYEQTLVKLLDKDYYNQVLKYVSEVNSKDNKWETRIENTKLVLNSVYSEDLSVKLDDLHLYGITYNENQETEYTKYDNSEIKTIEQHSYLFEYNPLQKLVPEFKDDDYYGVFSYKFSDKTGFTKQILNKTLAAKGYKDFDVIGLCRPLGKPYLQFTEESHPGFMELFTLICNDLNLVVKEPKNVIYSNFFIAKGNIYKGYLNKIILPTIELMETKYKDLAWNNANYISGLKGEALKQQTGLENYPFHVFILERLLSIWLENNNNITFKQIF